jgi:hypothetical protein
VKDFTLTNVKQSARIIEVKLAIEKLKGYRIECQNLTLIEEAELFDPKSQLAQHCLYPIMEELKLQQTDQNLN